MYKQIYGLIFFCKRRTYICVPCNHIFTDFYLISRNVDFQRKQTDNQHKKKYQEKKKKEKKNNNIITTVRESTISNQYTQEWMWWQHNTSTTKEVRNKKWKVSTLARTDFHPNMENTKNKTKKQSNDVNKKATNEPKEKKHVQITTEQRQQHHHHQQQLSCWFVVT